MKKYIACVLCVWLECSFAVNLPEQLDLTCDSSTYCNKELSCIGNVRLDAYPFKIRGERFHWQQERHFFSLEGEPLANAEYVLSDAPNSLTEFKIQAKQMSLLMNEEAHSAHVEASTQVACEYVIAGKLQVRAEGDKLLVRNTEGSVSYQVFLESTSDLPCRVTIPQGFYGSAKHFEYDTAKLCGSAKDLEGRIVLNLENGPGRLSVKADQMRWEGARGNLILEGNIHLSLYAGREEELEPFCVLTAEKRLVCQCVLTPQMSCHKVQIEGPMQLNHEVWGLLTGSGVTLLDCQKNKVIARGVEGSDGLLLDSQVCIETSQGKIQADRVALDLHQEALRGFSFHAQGNVGIESVQGQYVLAHEMHYDTRMQQGKLLSAPAQRVLFWEPRYDLNLSAPSCQFTLKNKEDKMQIKGHGDVRMTFLDMERKKIQTRFSAHEQR